MNEMLRLTLATLLLTIPLTALFLVLGALFPERLSRTRSALQGAPGRSFALGLVNALFFGLIAFVLLSLSEGLNGFGKAVLTLPALVILGLLGILLGLGLTAAVQHLAGRLFPDLAEWQGRLWSAVLLCLACGLPFAGWFLLLPYIGLAGIGAAILGFFQKG